MIEKVVLYREGSAFPNPIRQGNNFLGTYGKQHFYSYIKLVVMGFKGIQSLCREHEGQRPSYISAGCTVQWFLMKGAFSEANGKGFF